MGSVPNLWRQLLNLCYEVGPKSMSVFFFFFIKKINIRDNGYTIMNCWKLL